jgi:VIT1/CCC1 family predicted Fe2+/Mn2+ transporter
VYRMSPCANSSETYLSYGALPDGDKMHISPQQSKKNFPGNHFSDNASLEKGPLREHLGGHRQYWRDIVLAVNDGLASTFLLVAGVAGGGLSARSIYLTAVAGGVAGAISMAAGEWIATKSQNEVVLGEIELENKHILFNKTDEISELHDLLRKIGIDAESNQSLFQEMVQHYSNDNEALLQVMTALEFGYIDEEKRSPLTAGSVSFFLFFFGSLPSIIPFAVIDDPTMGLCVAAIDVTISLFIVGAVKTFATRGKWYSAAIENFVVAAGGGSVAYFTGLVFDRITRV